MTKKTGNDFWSRRKAAVREAEEREEAEREEQDALEKAASLEEMTDEEVYEELELPNPDELEEGDDFKPFLQSVVPERLRRRALRRLWTLNPTLANVDGLVEYGEDFTDAATVFEGIQTTYQVGKGMLKHIEKLAEQAEMETKLAGEDGSGAEAAADEVAEAKPSVVEGSEDTELTNEVEGASFLTETNSKASLTENDDFLHTDVADHDESVGSDDREVEPSALSSEAAITRRRMRFSFS